MGNVKKSELEYKITTSRICSLLKVAYPLISIALILPAKISYPLLFL